MDDSKVTNQPDELETRTPETARPADEAIAETPAEPSTDPAAEPPPGPAPAPELATAATTDTTSQPIDEYHEHAGSRWPLIIGLVLGAAAIAIGLFFLVRTIYRSAHHTKTVVPANTQQLPPQPGNSRGANNKSATSGGSSSNNSSSNSSAGNSATNSSGSSANSTNNAVNAAGNSSLPNSGPGDVVGLFAGTVLIAAGAHYVISLRKAN